MVNAFLLVFFSLAVTATAADADINLQLQQITRTVQETLAKGGATAVDDESSRLLNDTNLVDSLVREMMNFPLNIQEGMKKNAKASCASAWQVLTNETEVMIFSKAPPFNLTVSKKILAWDASGKPVPEILKYNTLFRGGFDECMKIEISSHHGFSMAYSSLQVYFVHFIASQPIVLPIPMTESVCIPSVCTVQDINATMMAINKEILSLPITTKVLIYPGAMITEATQDDIPLPLSYSNGAIVMVTVCVLFVIFVAIGTGYDLLLPYYVNYTTKHGTLNTSINDLSEEKKPLIVEKAVEQGSDSRINTFLHDALRSFSLYNTVPAILSTSQPPSAITSINGIRVISMFWVILGHSYFFLLPFRSVKNVVDLYEHFAGRFSAQAIVNAYFAVDSFFFLSGLLVAYLTLREMSKKKGAFPFVSFYVHRILRLTPTYMFVLFFFWFLSAYFVNGPNILAATGKHSNGYHYCSKYWWTNLLYINNFYPTNFGEQCMGWAWYLANDMQFYVISPLLLIPLYYFLPGGLIALAVSLISSIGVTGFIAGYYGYDANQLYPIITGKDGYDKNLPDQNSQIYGKPYCRVAPYLVGIALGYVLYKKHQISFGYIYNMLCYALIWCLAIITGLANVYGLYSSYHGHEFSDAENVLYYMLSRFTWGVTLFLVVYACHNGYGGVINRFLSLPIWVPLSRLTFTTYLVHEVVLLIVIGEMRDGVYYTDTMLTIHVIANTVLSYGAAAVISVFVEFPLSNLERALFKVLGKPLRSTARIGADSKD